MLLSFQPIDCRPSRSISVYSGPFAPDFAPGFAPDNSVRSDRALTGARYARRTTGWAGSMDIELQSKSIRVDK
jgi:hypothetical protein